MTRRTKSSPSESCPARVLNEIMGETIILPAVHCVRAPQYTGVIFRRILREKGGVEENLTEKAVKSDDRASGAVNVGLYTFRRIRCCPAVRRQRPV